MSQQEQAKTEGKITKNTIITTLFGLMLTGVGAFNSLQNKAQHIETMNAVQELKIQIVSDYATKSELGAAVGTLNAAQSKLWEKDAQLDTHITADDLKIQRLEDKQVGGKL